VCRSGGEHWATRSGDLAGVGPSARSMLRCFFSREKAGEQGDMGEGRHGGHMEARCRSASERAGFDLPKAPGREGGEEAAGEKEAKKTPARRGGAGAEGRWWNTLTTAGELLRGGSRVSGDRRRGGRRGRVCDGVKREWPGSTRIRTAETSRIECSRIKTRPRRLHSCSLWFQFVIVVRFDPRWSALMRAIGICVRGGAGATGNWFANVVEVLEAQTTFLCGRHHD